MFVLLVWTRSLGLFTISDLPASSASPSSSLDRPSTAAAVNACIGVQLPDGSDLRASMASHPPGTTYCLLAGRFAVATTISTDPGDRVVGAGRDATYIVGSALSARSPGIFETNDNNYFANFDISGAPTPTAGTGVFCGTTQAPSRSDCGKAFVIGGSPLEVVSVNCHDNGGSCIGGGGSASVIVDDLDCWGNGNAYSMNPGFRYAACIKRVAAYEPGNGTIVTNSHIHDNAWIGIWCDFCKYGAFRIENNRIIHNGSSGVAWEMSGGWTRSDQALIKGNVIQGNNYLGQPDRGGVSISTANDITVESNDFGRNRFAAVNILFSASRNPPQPDSSGVLVRDNSLNGDAVIGCGGLSLIKRLYSHRAGLTIILFALVAVMVLPFVMRLRGRLLIGVGGVLAAIFILTVLSFLSIQSGAMCFNNA